MILHKAIKKVEKNGPFWWITFTVSLQKIDSTPPHFHWFHVRLQWRHNGRDGVSNHQPHHCLLNRLFRSRSKKRSKLFVTGLCTGNSPVTGGFPVQMASNAENVSIWWRHHAKVSGGHFYGLVQERRNSSALAMKLHLCCINPLISLIRKDDNASWL